MPAAIDPDAARVRLHISPQNLDLESLTPRLYVLTDDIPADLEGFADIQTTLDVNKEHPSFRFPEL